MCLYLSIPLHFCISRHIVTFSSLCLLILLSTSPCYSPSKHLRPYLVLSPPSILALTHYELLAALMYSQYSLYHISTAAVRQEVRGEEERKKRNKEGGRGETFVLLISALKDTITSHSILSMFYTSPGPHAFALPRSLHVRPIF